MDSFVRRGRGLLNRRSTSPGAPDETVVELGENDSIEVSVVEQGTSTPNPPAPPTPIAPAPRTAEPFGSKNVRLIALIVVLVVVVAASVIAVRRAQDPTIDELRRRAGWSDLNTLRIGVSGDVPYLSDCTQGPTNCSGFDIEIARLVAAWLGVRSSAIEFDRVLPEDRERMQGFSFITGQPVDVDLVVAAFSMTKERMENDHVVFAGPYLNTQTTVLTRKDHPRVVSLAGLNDPITVAGKTRAKQRVCTHGTTTSRDYLRRETTATIVLRALNSECVSLLLAGDVDAAVTDAAILAGFQAVHANELRLNNIASVDDEHYGIGIGQDPTGQDERIQARRQLVLLALNDLLTAPDQNDWQDAFDLLPRTGPATGVDVQVVADDRQPTPQGLLPVRRWPWERLGSGSGR
jgi:glutamate transport system substrate-binding protein